MKYFDYFKDKFRSNGQRSAPELGQERKSEGYSGPDRITKLYEEKAQNLRVFSFSELRQASRGFNPLFKIGEGGFGSVYKGTIKPADGKGEPLVVAIKKLKHDGFQGHKEWVAEVQFLDVVEHPNIIKLIGQCGVDGESGIERLLVYEFMQNKSLDNHLFNCAFPPLPWKTRLRIILGAAKGLAYLHEGLQVQVIYRDLKPSNVLLDEDFNPKLSDFGLAIEGPMAGHTHVSTVVLGTYGYVAPEYILTGHLYVKSDVWSFGVVLYEILTGRRSIDGGRPTAEQDLLDWVKKFPAESKKLRSIMDPRLKNQYSIREAREVAKLADACLLLNVNERPKMSEVVERLKKIVQVTEEGSVQKMENRPKPKASESEIQAGIQESNTAELLTIKYAMESIVRAERKGKILLTIESNSTTAVKWIKDYDSRPRELWLMLKDIDNLISQIGTVVFKVVLQEPNHIEDSLVNDEVVRSYSLCAWW